MTERYIRLIHASEPRTASSSTPPAFGRGWALAGIGAANAADHGNPAGAHQFDDSERPHHFDERFDFFFLAGNFDDHLILGHVDNSAAENIAQLANFAPLCCRTPAP